MLLRACKIVVTRKKCFWELARLLQRGKSGFWRLQDCCKHFQKHFGRYSALSKTFFWDKEPHFLSPNPHFITWETNISIESNQDQSKYTSHKYPRVFFSRVVPLSEMMALRKTILPLPNTSFPIPRYLCSCNTECVETQIHFMSPFAG